MNLIMTKGLPGCGKTTWAREYQKQNPNTVRVNKDDLRAMLHNFVHSNSRENFVLETRDYVVRKALSEGHDVIVDDTNLNPFHEQTLKQIAKERDAIFMIQDFTAVPIEVCIEQDLKRMYSVGEKVIRQHYRQYLKKTVELVKIDPKLPDTIICDLDGTLCLFGDKNPYDRDFENDEANPVILDILQRIDADNFDGRGWANIIFVSGRSDKYFKVTRQWLNERGFEIYKLFMRKDGDSRKDAIIKQEIYEANIKGKFNVKFILDDRNQIVEFWRSQGLTCFQVAEGDF